MFIRPDRISLAACDACGTVAVLALAPGWRSFRSLTVRSAVGHHCRACAGHNDLVRAGLVYGVSPDTAAEYEEERHHGDRTTGRVAAAPPGDGG